MSFLTFYTYTLHARGKTKQKKTPPDVDLGGEGGTYLFCFPLCIVRVMFEMLGFVFFGDSWLASYLTSIT